MKRLLAFCLAVLMILALGGCGKKEDTSTPQSAVESFLEAVKNEDAEAIERLSVIGAAMKLDELGVTYDGAMTEILSQMKYKVTGTAPLDDDTITVVAEITTVNMAYAYRDYLIAVNQKLQDEGEEALFTDDDFAPLFLDAIKDTDEKITTEVDIQVEHQGENWLVLSDSIRLTNAVTGRLVDVVTAMADGKTTDEIIESQS